MVEHFILEARLLLRTRLFGLVVAAFFILAVLFGWQGGKLARDQAAAIDSAYALEAAHDAEALDKAAEITLGTVDPPWWQSPLNVQAWSYALVRHASLPPRPLAGVAMGDADLKPFLFRINPHPPDRWSNRASELTPSVAAYGGFDLTDLILILTPLLVIVAFADVIRDRNGSERQSLGITQCTRESMLVAARLLPRSIIVMSVVLAAACLGMVATVLPMTSAILTGVGSITGAFLGHALFWIAVAGLLTLTVRRAVTTFAGFVVLWFVLGVLAPVIVDAGARVSSPPPSPLDVFAAERTEMVAARMKEEELTRRYAAGDPLARDMLLTALEQQQLLITPTNLLIQQEVDSRRGAARRAERAKREAFEDRVSTLSSVSPTLIAREHVYTVAGRDYRRRTTFDSEVADYHAYLQDAFVPLLMRRATLEKVLLPEPFEFEEAPDKQ